MPRYDYRCSRGTVTEAVKGIGVNSLPCLCCGGVARRVPFYAGQQVKGVDGGKVPLGNSARNKHKQWDLALVREAQGEMVYDADKAGVQAPDLWKQATRKGQLTQANA